VCTPYTESQKMVAMATSLRCRVSALPVSAFCQRTIQTPLHNHCLVTIIHTKLVNNNFSPKNSCRGNVPQHRQSPISHMIPTAHLSPQPKQHLGRFSCFCTVYRRMSLYFTVGRPFPPQNCPFPSGDLDPI